jgi:hypothetical protein
LAEFFDLDFVHFVEDFLHDSFQIVSLYQFLERVEIGGVMGSPVFEKLSEHFQVEPTDGIQVSVVKDVFEGLVVEFLMA